MSFEPSPSSPKRGVVAVAARGGNHEKHVVVGRVDGPAQVFGRAPLAVLKHRFEDVVAAHRVVALRAEVHRFAIGVQKHAFLAVLGVDDRAQILSRSAALNLNLVNVARAQAAFLVAHKKQAAPIGRVGSRRLVVLGVDARAQLLGLAPLGATQFGLLQVAAIVFHVHEQALAVGREAHGGIVALGIDGVAQVGGRRSSRLCPRGCSGKCLRRSHPARGRCCRPSSRPAAR